MESPNPRRKQLSVAPPSLISGAAFKKGATFHSPNSPKSQDNDPILSILTLPQRSSTCLKDLEAGLLANNNRISSILGAVDRSFSDLSSFSKDSQETIVDEPEPVPSFMIGAIDHHGSKNAMDIDAPVPRRKHHASDSGIGSTETSEASVHKSTPASSTSHVETGINGDSKITPPVGASAQQALSEYACRQIQKHIILPIIRDEKLKPFHSLVHGLPYRVARKEITCLRDLEKVILWLAPVRQYAAIMAAERARAAASEAQTAGSSKANDKLTLVGGLSQTGRPAELVRTVNGKTVSLRTGEEINMEDYKNLKRSIDEHDDDIERSMARRKKNAVPIIQTCKECGKDFKRPCDLTKHEKTHSRPWKCDEVGCKYHTYGWPTEKERDRHMNDKHSAAPKMYKCQYVPCPYESKRESNCKQHMEKAHGYVYLRAKNNGKARAPSTVGVPTTPMLSPGSDVFNAPTPAFSDDLHSVESLEDPNWNFSGVDDMNYMSGASNFAEIFGPGLNDFNFAAPPFDYAQAGPSNTHRTSYDTNSLTPPAEENSIFGTHFDWSNANMDLTNYNVQIPTPALTHKQGLTSRAPSTSTSPPCLSPTGQGEAMLFSPFCQVQHDCMDEGFAEMNFNQMQDFHLYSSGVSTATISPPMELFAELPNYSEKNSQMMDTQMTYFENM